MTYKQWALINLEKLLYALNDRKHFEHNWSRLNANPEYSFFSKNSFWVFDFLSIQYRTLVCLRPDYIFQDKSNTNPFLFYFKLDYSNLSTSFHIFLHLTFVFILSLSFPASLKFFSFIFHYSRNITYLYPWLQWFSHFKIHNSRLLV